ncbi:MAG: hemerythrin family protein [Anaeromyxobacter sp.]
MPVRWTDDLATGIEAIDAQHRGLYDAVNELHGIMRSHELSEVSTVLEALETYAAQHFRLEEREMAEAGYPGLAAHAGAHRAFALEFERQRLALHPTPTASGVVELSAWLTDWLRDHVRKVDGEMARYLRAFETSAERPAQAKKPVA